MTLEGIFEAEPAAVADTSIGRTPTAESRRAIDSSFRRAACADSPAWRGSIPTTLQRAPSLPGHCWCPVADVDAAGDRSCGGFHVVEKSRLSKKGDQMACNFAIGGAPLRRTPRRQCQHRTSVCTVSVVRQQLSEQRTFAEQRKRREMFPFFILDQAEPAPPSSSFRLRCLVLLSAYRT